MKFRREIVWDRDLEVPTIFTRKCSTVFGWTFGRPLSIAVASAWPATKVDECKAKKLTTHITAPDLIKIHVSLAMKSLWPGGSTNQYSWRTTTGAPLFLVRIYAEHQAFTRK